MEKAFEEYLKKTNLSDNTKKSYQTAVKQYFSMYTKVDKVNLKSYKTHLIEAYKPKTVNLRIRAINCFLDSIDLGDLKLSSIKIQQKTYLDNVISEADYEYFKKCLHNEDEMFWYYVIRFMAATGARVSELVQIKAEHVKAGYIDLYTKGGKIRRLYIPEALRTEALSWIEERKITTGFIFLNRYGEKITTRGISGQLKKLGKKYDMNLKVIYPHSFRHRFAKSFLEKYNDIALLADLMGHESIETTRIYLRKTSSVLHAFVDKYVDW
ncbi:MAG: tyrosine-type recombinase/integrase [Lachnospiraceae bacterium]|nr:tyrosine-type recombinase/integrase [Lachnospiraceae bacterium]